MSISEEKILLFLTAEVLVPVSRQHTILQPQAPLHEMSLPRPSQGPRVIIFWQTLDRPKYVKTYSGE